MDFESPDVEKDFPGLYASESGRKSNESDFSDDGHDRPSKKELLIGKRKDKKDKKDRGYATLEGESSPEEDIETKSPSKSKKSKTFKFPSKKEKREKSREKDGKEKETDKERERKKKDKDDKDTDKEKRKDKDKEKSKQKLKDRKKGKHWEETVDIGEEQPIFGVALQMAVERGRCHDGVELPLVVRNCIDYIEEYGMTVDGLYKVSAVKSKVQHLRKLYNQREVVDMSEFDPMVATSLLILFLRELPEPILENGEVVSRFEQAASLKEVALRETQLIDLISQLPKCNKTLLAWVILHLDHLTAHEKTTKMNAQSIAMTLSPVLQMSHRLLLALLLHCKALFANVELSKYIPPLASGSPNLPDTMDAIAAELAKQESLLSQIHMQMNAGFVTKLREEQLWEVQRLITQLKRKYKTVQKLEGSTHKSLEEDLKLGDEGNLDISLHKAKIVPEEDNSYIKADYQPLPMAVVAHKESCSQSMDESNDQCDTPEVNEKLGMLPASKHVSQTKCIQEKLDASANELTPDEVVNRNSGETLQILKARQISLDSDEELRERLIYGELLAMQESLGSRIAEERGEIKRLAELLTNKDFERSKPIAVPCTPEEADRVAIIELVLENQMLEKKKATLVRTIIEENIACVELRAQFLIQQLSDQDCMLTAKKI
ncbi:ralA-binding protein 1 isoform X1 [Neodiprion pinetum]|uniref:ralA-binding protein 1 isoform X1 n=1 Tax=Neodiprion pinetum TaxID=441929 RepID=UPI001EDCCF60|nr:ralA-binding protein 1-like isoform X1 [Neodiprion pinetum]XP_046489137.1 ralA-binding protein 1-like isoform X1 [Neodiprion pinetum]